MTQNIDNSIFSFKPTFNHDLTVNAYSFYIKYIINVNGMITISI